MESKIIFLILILFQIYKSLCFEIFLMNNLIIENYGKAINISQYCIHYINESLNEFKDFCLERDNKLEDIFDEKNFLNVSKIELKFETYSHIYSFSSFTKNKFYSLHSCQNKSQYLYFMVDIEADYEAKENKKLYISKEYLNFEDSYFLYGFCLPFNYSVQTCNKSDVREIINFTNDMLNNYLFPSKSKISISIINHDRPYEVFGYIIIGIILFQIALITFTYPLYKFLAKILKKKEKIEENENNNEKNNNKHNGKYLIPKWLTSFNSFSLSNNMHELFNVKSNSTEMNNYSGLYAIRGLNAISMFFTVLGLTFIGIYNSPLKITGVSQIRSVLFHELYFLVFIGLRYSPRIIFSCSGYTLSYKYLSFMDKYTIDFSLMKFAFYQFYKYFILIFYNLFFRYSLNLLIRKFFPYWFFLQQKIINNYKGNYNGDYPIYQILMSFLGVDLFLENQSKKSDQNISDYFWIPYNEVFFFIFGIIIMTIGYKYKLKIDVFILILILLGFIGKIAFSYLYHKYYSTLYYYLFDYGKFMINPLFNLTYFLIGIYFGLINYALQKGATNQFDNSIFNKIKKFSFEKKDENGENEENKKNEEKEANNDKDKMDKDEKTEENNIINSANIKDDNNNNYFNRVSYTSSFSESITSNDMENTDLFKDEDDDDLIGFKYSSNEEIIEEIPFLYTIVKYINKRKKFRHYKIFYGLCFILIILPILSHYLILNLYNGDAIIKDLKKENNVDEFYKTINLYDYITNFTLNLIFRIDIEIFILLIHWLFIDLNIMGKYNILTFFSNISWGIFDKSCFSFEIISNMIILFVIYSSETFISVNIFTIFLYFIFISVLILLFTFLSYIYLELPLKRLTKLILNKNDNLKDYEEDTLFKDEEKEENNLAKKQN